VWAYVCLTGRLRHAHRSLHARAHRRLPVRQSHPHPARPRHLAQILHGYRRKVHFEHVDGHPPLSRPADQRHVLHDQQDVRRRIRRSRPLRNAREGGICGNARRGAEIGAEGAATGVQTGRGVGEVVCVSGRRGARNPVSKSQRNGALCGTGQAYEPDDHEESREAGVSACRRRGGGWGCVLPLPLMEMRELCRKVMDGDCARFWCAWHVS